MIRETVTGTASLLLGPQMNTTGWLQRAISDMPEGARIRITVEVAADTWEERAAAYLADAEARGEVTRDKPINAVRALRENVEWTGAPHAPLPVALRAVNLWRGVEYP